MSLDDERKDSRKKIAGETDRDDVLRNAIGRVERVKQGGDEPLPEYDAMPGTRVARIAVDAIERDTTQPRRVFEEQPLAALARSLKEYGLLQPPAVRPLEWDAAGVPTKYRLVYGERRWRAAKLAGWEEIECIVVLSGDQDVVEDIRRRDQQYAENAHREGLTLVEEALELDSRVELEIERERRSNPEVKRKEVLERVAGQRGMTVRTAYKLLQIPKAPESLRARLDARMLSREVGYLLAAAWSRVESGLEEADASAFRVRAAIDRYANEQGLSPKAAETVERFAKAAGREDVEELKTLNRRAIARRKLAEGRFDGLVASAVREQWSVKTAKGRLRFELDWVDEEEVQSESNRTAGRAAHDARLIEAGTGRYKGRLYLYVDRFGRATADELECCVRRLREVLEQAEQALAASRKPSFGDDVDTPSEPTAPPSSLPESGSE